MEESDIKNILAVHFQSEVSNIEFEEATWGDAGDEKGNLSPRDCLIPTFRRRLRNVDQDSPLKNELAIFVSNLECLPFDAKLFSWVCMNKDKRWVGWASQQKVIYSVLSGN